MLTQRYHQGKMMNHLAKIRRFIHQKRRQYAVAVPWASIPMLSTALARQRPMEQPMILMISMPRSGSTWVGETLAQSPKAAYLHEPFTQTLRRATEEDFFQFPLNDPPAPYWKVAAHLHMGLPRFRSGIVRHPDKWKLTGRSDRQIVIKEVNSLGLPWFLNEFQPRVIHLVRHPAAVVNSRLRLGWGHHVDKMFLPETLKHHRAEWLDGLDDPWVLGGAVHGLTTSLTCQLLADYSDLIEVKYEALCQNPMSEFKTLLDFCGLPFTDDVHQHIRSRIDKDVGRENNPWGTNRNTTTMPERWMHELEPDQITRIRQGFEAMHSNFYKEDYWWPQVEQDVNP